MANRLYFVIVRVRREKGKGQFELHNSLRRKDVVSSRPDCMAKAIRYYDKGSYYVACKVIQDWRHEMKDRFGAIEVEPLKNPIDA